MGNNVQKCLTRSRSDEITETQTSLRTIEIYHTRVKKSDTEKKLSQTQIQQIQISGRLGSLQVSQKPCCCNAPQIHCTPFRPVMQFTRRKPKRLLEVIKASYAYQKSRTGRVYYSERRTNTGTVVREQDQVAETFNDYFTNITKSLISHKHCAFKDQVHIPQIPKLHNGSMNTFSFDRTNQHIVKDVLDNIKPNKAPGNDSIPPRAVKASSKSIVKPLSDLINTIITRSQVPDTWKHGQITPLHKKDSVLYKANFRPVTCCLFSQKCSKE